MKNPKSLAVIILVLILLAGFTACGNSASSQASQTSTGQTDNQQASSDVQQSSDQASAEAQSPASTIVTGALPEADTGSSADNLLGSWKDVNSPDRFVNITKTDSGYQYEDNEGKCPATFEKGVLKVKVSDTDAADVYIDPDTGHLLSSYQDNISEYEKK